MFAKIEDYRFSKEKEDNIKLKAIAYFNAKNEYTLAEKDTLTPEGFAHFKLCEYKMELAEMCLNAAMTI